MATDKRDVRLQIFVTAEMDDKITDIADIMGMTKNEICRYAIGQLVLGYETGVSILKQKAEDAELGKK